MTWIYVVSYASAVLPRFCTFSKEGMMKEFTISKHSSGQDVSFSRNLHEAYWRWNNKFMRKDFEKTDNILLAIIFKGNSVEQRDNVQNQVYPFILGVWKGHHHTAGTSGRTTAATMRCQKWVLFFAGWYLLQKLRFTELICDLVKMLDRWFVIDLLSKALVQYGWSTATLRCPSIVFRCKVLLANCFWDFVSYNQVVVQTSTSTKSYIDLTLNLCKPSRHVFWI